MAPNAPARPTENADPTKSASTVPVSAVQDSSKSTATVSPARQTPSGTASSATATAAMPHNGALDSPTPTTLKENAHA